MGHEHALHAGGPKVSVRHAVHAETVERLAQGLVAWIVRQVREAGREGAAVGLSGGVDSSVTAALCSRACPGATLGVIMPCESDPEDAAYARMAAEALGIEVVEVPLDRTYRALLEGLRAASAAGRRGSQATGPDDRYPAANLKARLRMATLYYFANLRRYLVVGTGNRSELMLGYFTKYGDGGVDLLPLGNLVKSQVRALARHLGVPEAIVERPPTAGLWPGQTDEGELGLRYEQIDAFLLGRAVPGPVRQRIEELVAASAHKRLPPPVPPLYFGRP